MALAAQAVLNRRPPWPALLVVLALAGCVSAPPEREPPPPMSPPPTAPAQGASLPPAQPLPRPVPPAAVVRPGPPPSAPPLGEPMTTPAPAAQPSATGSLIALADRQAATGDYASAAAQLERALRIRPQDPVLWQKLAWLRLQNGEFDQAATLAARSDSLAGNNAAVREQNRRIVELARARQRP